jgi:hypothetical protein
MRLTPDERSQLRDNLADVVWIWALRLVDSGAVASPPASVDPAAEPARAAAQLARLAALEEIRACLTDLADRAADDAARYGAGYPELGEAVGISRQAARKRWPSVARIIRDRRPRRRRDVDEAISRFKTDITDGWY